MPLSVQLPKVQFTKILINSLLSNDAKQLGEEFSRWKGSGTKGEFEFYFFGKDGQYQTPCRLGRRVLWHVHLPPTTDLQAAVRWEKSFFRKSRKTSDASLIYAYDSMHGYLLIYIAREPEGHAISDMSVPSSAKFMNNLADVAEAFIHDGRVLI